METALLAVLRLIFGPVYLAVLLLWTIAAVVWVGLGWIVTGQGYVRLAWPDWSGIRKSPSRRR